MARRSITVASLQLRAHDRSDFSRAWPRAVRAMRLAARDADLVVLPEGTVPAYVLGSERYAGDATERALNDSITVARETRTVIVFGGARLDGKRVYNAAFAVDADGTLAGVADKRFLWHFDRRWFEPGARAKPIATRAGTIGVLICADGRIPTIASDLVAQGAELLVMPTAWVTSGRDPKALENAQADLLARVRARENGVPFVAANKCGTEDGCVAYCGKSQIVSADGSVLALAPQRRPCTIYATVELRDRSPRCDATLLSNVCRYQSNRPGRIALFSRPRDARDTARLSILDADAAIAPGMTRVESSNGSLHAAFVDDATALDPRGLVAHRRAGATLAVWVSGRPADDWTVAFARARALELRMYVAVLSARGGRAFAVDPDGAVIAGTFDGYEMAVFPYDPARAERTQLVPGTDVLDGLARASR